MRGKNGKSVKSNFVQYGLASLFLDTLTFDITRSPIRNSTTFDAIVCDRIFSQFECL
jgi:tRNA (guanine10-N2)-methyltransferase